MASASGLTNARGSAAPEVVVRHDHEVLDEWSAAIDDLHRDQGTPVTSRRRWLTCWYRAFDDHEPLIVAVVRPDGTLDALACLAHRRRAALTTVVAAGHEASDYAQFSARSPVAAEQLVRAIIHSVGQLRRSWSLTIRHLFADDQMTDVLHRHLPHAALAPTTPSFAVRIGEVRTKEAILSKNYRRDIRRKTKRLEQAGVVLEREVVRDEPAVARLLPEIQRIHQSRDGDAGRVNRLGDPRFRQFFEQVLRSHARDGLLELAVVRIDGALAAYDFAFVDDGTRRLWNGRFDPQFADSSPGKLSLDVALGAALDDPGCDEFDLMISDEPYKRSFGAEPRSIVDLHAASSAPVRMALDLPRQVKEALRPLLRHRALEESWQRIKAWRRRSGSSTG